MPLLYSSQTTAPRHEATLRDKVRKATDHSQWHRTKKQRIGAPASSSNHFSGGWKSASSSPSLELHCNPATVKVTVKQSSPSHAGQQSPKTVSTNTLDLLNSPVDFVVATHLTFEAEMAVLRPRKTVRNISNEHRRRREASGKISKAWPLSSKQPRLGLWNPSMFCYRRSVLQSFLHLPIFMNWAKYVKKLHQDKSSHSKDSRCIACDFSSLADVIWSRSRAAKEATAQLDRAVRVTPCDYPYEWRKTHDQADAHEYLSFLVDVCQEQFKTPDETTVQSMFKLCINSEWTCRDCKFVHQANAVNEIGFSIAIQDPSGCNLQDYIRQYLHDRIDGATCENCRSVGNRTRNRTIEAAPEVLFIHLQRFRSVYNSKSGRLTHQKENKDVDFPQILDLSAYGANEKLRAKDVLRYKLSSVVAHKGSLRMGHYIAYAEAPTTGVMEFNDDFVSVCNRSDMFKPRGGFTPYILTYVSSELTELNKNATALNV